MNQVLIQDELRILQWNCRGIYNKIGELCKIIETLKIDVVLLQETFLARDKVIKINNFNIIRVDRNRRGGGVLIAIKNNWSYKMINIESNSDEIELVGCSLKIDERENLDIVSIYLNHNININMSHLDNIFNKIKKPFIIGGDFNAHSMEWGCNNNSIRADVIIEALEKYDSVFLNDGSFTRIQSPPNPSSAIDLTITDNYNSFKCEWFVSNASCGSDHLPVITKIRLNNPKVIPTTKKVMSQKKINLILNNKKFIEEKFRKGMSADDFMKCLNDIVISSQIEIPVKKHNQNKPWWTNECSRQLATLFQCTKKFRQTGNQESFDALKLQKKVFKNTTREAKREGWYKFCSSVTHESSISEIWKMAKIFKGNCQVYQSNEDCGEWIEEFMNKHSQPTPCEYLNTDQLRENENINFDQKITTDLVQNKINSLKKSAAGIDEINNVLLRSLPRAVIEILTDIFNDIIEKRKIPFEWKITKVIAIQKPGRPVNDALGKRPISIFSKVRRLFESCFLENLDRWAENENKLSVSQYGFRKGKSTRDCVANLIADIKIAWKEKKIVGAVILDISAAYDNVNIKSFIKNLNELGAPRKTCELLWEMYSEKINRYLVNNQIFGERLSSIGFPQGLPSSPASFNLAIASIDECLEDEVRSLQFADDNIIYCAGRDIKKIEEKLNQTLKNLEVFLSSIGLDISKEKTKSMVFSRKHQNVPIKIILSDTDINQVDNFKYVGVFLDRKLLMNKHLKEIAASAGKAVNVMRSVAGTRWGVDPKCLDMLYKACIRSKLEYCSFVYPTGKSILPLEKIQWRACRVISGCMNSTHTKTLEILTSIEPLRLRFEKLQSNFLNMIYSHNNPLREKLGKLDELGVNFMNEKPPDLYQSEDFPFFRQTMWEKNANSIIKLKLSGKKDVCSNKEAKIKFNELKEKNYKDCDFIFTDGSKREEKTSFAIHHQNEGCNTKIKFNRDNVSIFVAESSAILKALAHMQDEHPLTTKICIATDSLSVINAIENVKNTFKIHFMIGKILNMIEIMKSQGKEIHLLWILQERY